MSKENLKVREGQATSTSQAAVCLEQLPLNIQDSLDLTDQLQNPGGSTGSHNNLQLDIRESSEESHGFSTAECYSGGHQNPRGCDIIKDSSQHFKQLSISEGSLEVNIQLDKNASSLSPSLGSKLELRNPNSEAELGAGSGPSPSPTCDPSEHPFETMAGDHAETPLEAFQHIEPMLSRIAKRLGTTKAALRIYDPFYCEGAVLRHMTSLGFDSVYNRCEDFYAVAAAHRCPDFDVLVTNPPFSEDHIERIFRFATASRNMFQRRYVPCVVFPIDKGANLTLDSSSNASCTYNPLSSRSTLPSLLTIPLITPKMTSGPKPMVLGPAKQPYVFVAPEHRFDVRQMRAAVPEATTNGDKTYVTNESEGSATLDIAVPSLGESLAEGDFPPASPTVVSVETCIDSPSKNIDKGGVQQLREPQPSTPLASSTFQVAAGSFQCVWFFSLGESHQKPVVEWFRKQQEALEGGAECMIASSVSELPQLMAVQKLTPAERRWRKKQQQQQDQSEGESPSVQPTCGIPHQGRARPGPVVGGRGGRSQSGHPSDAHRKGSVLAQGSQGSSQRAGLPNLTATGSANERKFGRTR